MTSIDITSFRSAFSGQVFEPADAGYDEANAFAQKKGVKIPMGG